MSEAERAFAIIRRAPNSTEAASQLLRLVTRAFSVRDAVRSSTASALALIDDDKTTREREAAESAELLAEHQRLGGARGAAGRIARRRAPNDPHAQANLKRRINRLVKNNGALSRR